MGVVLLLTLYMSRCIIEMLKNLPQHLILEFPVIVSQIFIQDFEGPFPQKIALSEG